MARQPPGLAHLQSGLTHMSTPLENLEQQYAAEVVKVDADEGLLKRLERGIRGLKGLAESTGRLAEALDEEGSAPSKKAKTGTQGQTFSGQQPKFGSVSA
ncbi:TPA: hypothetical protein ACH3X1_009302 [Trebouxia sp. C0004]